MASSDWSTLIANNVSHSLVDTLGLDMDQNYCWNVRTTLNPGHFATRNITVGQHLNGDSHSNLKIRALLRKNAEQATPFMFLRSGDASNTNAYKLGLRADGKFALYHEQIDANFATTPLLISQDTYAINTTHHIEFLAYSQSNGDTFLEAYYGDRNTDPYVGESWDVIFKTMIFYSDSPILAGYVGFGHYGTLAGAYSYIDLFEVYEEQV